MTTETATTHRQGPWEFQPHLKAVHTAGNIVQNGHLIATVQFDRGTQFDGMEIVPERDAANGHLLAAAPAMLEALEAVKATMPLGTSGAASVMDVVLAAIREARGEVVRP